MPILFVLKTCSCGFFFKKAEKYGPNYTKIHSTPPPPTPPPPSPPPCPSPNIAGFQSLRTKTLCMCVFYAIGGGGGQKGGEGRRGGIFKSVFGASFSQLVKKNRDIFWHKKSQQAKFQRIPSNLNNRTEKGTYASVWWSPSIRYGSVK